jgi:heme/copper-type cytochrome/quinol oxidase subunit 4
MSSRSWLVEVGFIIFIISSYVYFLYHDAINSGIQNLYKFGASAITVSIVVTGVYYLYKNPDQIPSLLTKFLKKKA